MTSPLGILASSVAIFVMSVIVASFFSWSRLIICSPPASMMVLSILFPIF